MTITYYSTTLPNTFVMGAQGDSLYVMPNAFITSFNSYAISSNYGVNISVLGTVIGTSAGITAGASGQTAAARPTWGPQTSSSNTPPAG